MEIGSDDSVSRTPEDVDADLGKVLVKSVEQSRSNRILLRLLTVPILFDLVLSICFGWVMIQQRHDTIRFHREQIQTCHRFNESRAGELALWVPLLRAPRTPLAPDATAVERKAYEDATNARVGFESNLHKYFDPIEC